MMMESSSFESVLELPTKENPPIFVNPLQELCDAMALSDLDHHLMGKQAGVGTGARSFPFPR